MLYIFPAYLSVGRPADNPRYNKQDADISSCAYTCPCPSVCTSVSDAPLVLYVNVRVLSCTRGHRIFVCLQSMCGVHIFKHVCGHVEYIFCMFELCICGHAFVIAQACGHHRFTDVALVHTQHLYTYTFLVIYECYAYVRGHVCVLSREVVCGHCLFQLYVASIVYGRNFCFLNVSGKVQLREPVPVSSCSRVGCGHSPPPPVVCCSAVYVVRVSSTKCCLAERVHDFVRCVCGHTFVTIGVTSCHESFLAEKI